MDKKPVLLKIMCMIILLAAAFYLPLGGISHE